MNDNSAAVFLRRIPALLFCFVLCAAAMLFSARMLIPKAVPSQLLVRPPFRQLLAGGASEIGGTPPRPRAGFRGKIQWEVQQNFPFRVSILEAANHLPRLVGWNVPLLGGAGATTKFDAGRGFVGNAKWSSKSESMNENARILAFMRTLANRNPNTLFVVEPPRIPKGEPFSGTFDFSAERCNDRIRFLQEAGVPTLDLEPPLSDGNPFFRTDHHMTIKAGLLAARALAEKLSSDFGLSIDLKLLEDSAFGIHVLPGAFLGSYGKQVTLARCSPDDFPVATAKSPSRFRVEIPQKGIDMEGDGDVLLDKRLLVSEYSYRVNQYAAYGHGDNGLIRVTNLSHPFGPRLLVFSDSFDNVCITFLANAVSEIVDVDLRHFDGTLDDIFQKGSFDAVVCLFDIVPTEEQLSSVLSPVSRNEENCPDRNGKKRKFDVAPHPHNSGCNDTLSLLVSSP